MHSSLPILIKVEFDYFFFRECMTTQFPMEDLYKRASGDMEMRWQICYRFGSNHSMEYLDCFVWAPLCSHSIVRFYDNGTHDILAAHDKDLGLVIFTKIPLVKTRPKDIFELAETLQLTHSRLPMLKVG